jgi:hypothetical protein
VNPTFLGRSACLPTQLRFSWEASRTEQLRYQRRFDEEASFARRTLSDASVVCGQRRFERKASACDAFLLKHRVFARRCPTSASRKAEDRWKPLLRCSAMTAREHSLGSWRLTVFAELARTGIAMSARGRWHTADHVTPLTVPPLRIIWDQVVCGASTDITNSVSAGPLTNGSARRTETSNRPSLARRLRRCRTRASL